MKSKQLIFIDDSGDPGFKLEKGASGLFVVACVIFSDTIEAELVSASIKALKRDSGWKQEREYKFHKTTEDQKKAFFKETSRFNFRIRAIVVDKSKVEEPKLKKDDSFYQKIVVEVLDRFKGMKEANVYLDGEKGRNYRNRSAAELRKVLNRNKQRISKFKVEDSKGNVLIQLADMIAGAIREKYELKGSSGLGYLRSMKDKIEEIYLYK